MRRRENQPIHGPDSLGQVGGTAKVCLDLRWLALQATVAAGIDKPLLALHRCLEARGASRGNVDRFR
jgi:hypothetical protein